MEPSPLVSIGTACVVKICPNATPQVLAKLEDVMARFLRYEIDGMTACQVFLSTIGSGFRAPSSQHQ